MPSPQLNAVVATRGGIGLLALSGSTPCVQQQGRTLMAADVVTSEGVPVRLLTTHMESNLYVSALTSCAMLTGLECCWLAWVYDHCNATCLTSDTRT